MAPKISAVIVAMFGGFLLIGGIWLVSLGGSWYYLVAGAVWAWSAVWLWQGKKYGVWLYSAALAATVIWAIWEAGFNGWALAPRIGLPAVIGAWLWTPWLRRRLR